VIQKGELNAADAETIISIQVSVRIDAGAVSPVVSSDDDEVVAQNKNERLENLALKSSSFLSATKSTAGELSCLFQ
jgi:hypothetical protein